MIPFFTIPATMAFCVCEQRWQCFSVTLWYDGLSGENMLGWYGVYEGCEYANATPIGRWDVVAWGQRPDWRRMSDDERMRFVQAKVEWVLGDALDTFRQLDAA